MTVYTTYGDVRGCCGHKHDTLEGAERCLEKDQQGCRASHGYSDREIAIVGPDEYLYRDEGMNDWIPGKAGRTGGGAKFA